MQITPLLEKLCLLGLGKARTWTVGTASAELPIRSNTTIIVYGIQSEPFADSDAQNYGNGSLGQWLARINHQLTLSSQGERISFLQRSLYLTQRGLSGTLNTYPCFGIYTENVVFQAVRILPPLLWTGVNLAFAPGNSNVKQLPLGYGAGNGVPLVDRITFFNAEVRPFPQSPTLQPTSFQDFQVPVTINTGLLPPDQADEAALKFPMVTIHYVEINKPRKDVQDMIREL